MNSNSKIDLSQKKEDLIREMQEIYAKIGNWSKFCELCLKQGEYAKAVMAAPHVSIEYWKYCLNQYVAHSEENKSQDTALLALMADNMGAAVNSFLESNNPKDAQITWVTRKFCSEERTVRPSQYATESHLASIESALNQQDEGDELFKITTLIAKDYLLGAKPVLAAASFLAVRDVFWTLKTLVMADEIELAMLIGKFTKRTEFDAEIYTHLALREIARNK